MSHSIPNRQRNHRSSKGLPCSTALSPSDAAPEKRHGTMLHGPEIAPWQKIQLINPSEKKVSWDYYSQYIIWKNKTCSKPPTSDSKCASKRLILTLQQSSIFPSKTHLLKLKQFLWHVQNLGKKTRSTSISMGPLPLIR